MKYLLKPCTRGHNNLCCHSGRSTIDLTPMKHRIAIISVGIWIALSGCSSRAERAAEYNDSIISYQKSIIDALVQMDSLFADSNTTKDKLGYSYANLQSRVKLAILALDSIGPFQKDPSLQISARDLFRNYEELVDHDYKKLVEIKLLPVESVSMEVVDSNLAIQNHIHLQSKIAQDKFLNAQLDFGKKFHLEFE